MDKVWHKLSERSNIDLETISAIHIKTHELLKEYTKSDEELFYTYYRTSGESSVNYMAVDIPDFGRFLYKKYFYDKGEIEKYIANGERIIEKSRLLKNMWEGNNRKTNDDLIELYKKFLDMFKEVGSFYTTLIFIMIEYWQVYMDKVIEEMVERNNLSGDKEKIARSILKPLRKTAMNELRDKLLAGEDQKKLLEEYQYLRSWAMIWYEALEEKFLKDLVKNNNLAENDLYSKEELMNLLHPSDEEQKEIEVAPYLIYMKDFRDDLRREFAYIWVFMFEEISKQCKVDYHDMGLLSLEELSELINGKNFAEKIERRKSGPCIITAARDDFEVIVIDEFLPVKYIDHTNMVNMENVELLEGLSVVGGNITAKVKLIDSTDDIANFPEGSVLIANTTHPNYLPAMQKASAFVTNEGGMLCHAAIVAREMHKPCIVGTKIATKVLKDRDLVEVDANNGVVRIMNNELT